MKNINTILAVGTVAAVCGAAEAALVVGWTIPSALSGTLTGSSYSVGVANQGDSTVGSNLSGVHASTATAWSSPTGNGSSYSFSSNGWAIGDYYEISFTAANYQDLSVTWDQARSNTGPATFKMQVSVNSGAFVDVLPSYSVAVSTSPNAWNATTPNSLFTSTQALGAGANGASNVRVRFVATVAPTGTSPSAGTGRIDNIFVNGTLIPAPGAMALLGVAGLVGARRRR